MAVTTCYSLLIGSLVAACQNWVKQNENYKALHEEGLRSIC